MKRWFPSSKILSQYSPIKTEQSHETSDNLGAALAWAEIGRSRSENQNGRPGPGGISVSPSSAIAATTDPGVLDAQTRGIQIWRESGGYGGKSQTSGAKISGRSISGAGGGRLCFQRHSQVSYYYIAREIDK